MHIEFLVEEYSAEAALKNLLPSIFSEETTFAIRPFSGKQDLLSQLPKRLSGYRKWLPEDWRIVVLVDRDRENCRTLKARLEDAARQADLATKSSVRGQGQFKVVNRLAIEEMEAWYFGDPAALKQAYPRLPEPTLKAIARELVATVRKNVTIDWTLRENVRAQLRVMVKRILRKYGYPPDKQEKATQTVLEQAEA
jgi:hypothetical protein